MASPAKTTTKTATTTPKGPYVPDPNLAQFGLQTGVNGEANYTINMGLSPGLVDYTKTVYENSPYARQNYDVAAGQSTAGKADAFGRQAQSNEMSATHLDQMLGSNSPLMRRAQQHAMAGAGGRGLMNSSIAVGNAQGEMIDRAQPFALQDAQSHGQAAMETLANKQSAANLNAQLLTQSNMGNAANTTQAGIQSMQARATRDRDLLLSDLGGRRDVALHLMGVEGREDTQDWQTKEREFSQVHQSSENELNRIWTSGENSANRTQDWAISYLNALTSRGMSQDAARGVVLDRIASSGLDANQQAIAMKNAMDIFKNYFGDPYSLPGVPAPAGWPSGAASLPPGSSNTAPPPGSTNSPQPGGDATAPTPPSDIAHPPIGGGETRPNWGGTGRYGTYTSPYEPQTPLQRYQALMAISPQANQQFMQGNRMGNQYYEGGGQYMDYINDSTPPI